MRRVVFDLFTEMRDVNSEIVGLRTGLGTPDIHQELAVGEDLAAMNHEQTKQGIFGRSQFDFRATSSHDPGGQIDFQVSEGEQGVGRLTLGMAHGGTQPREQLACAEGLGHIIIGARIERVDFIVFVVSDCEHDHRNTAPFPEPFEDLEAIHIRQTQIEQDNVRPSLRGLRKTFIPIGGIEDPVTVRLEPDAKQATYLRLVVNDEGNWTRL